MSPLFQKLNAKSPAAIVVLNAPASFEAELDALAPTPVLTEVPPEVHFALAFVQTQKELDSFAQALTEAAVGDALLWFAYPKQSSKRFTCEFNRDTGWAVLGAAGWEGVRQVAIDDDWSALRFRRVEFIKSMTRAPQRAGSEEGKRRTQA